MADVLRVQVVREFGGAACPGRVIDQDKQRKADAHLLAIS